MTARTELPIRVLDGPDGMVIAGLCGVESGVIAPAARHPGDSRVATDWSPAALIRMAMHVKSCRECQYRQLEISRSAIIT